MTSPSPSPESIFGDAIELHSPAERAAFLQRACGEDRQLHARLKRLVADHFRAGRFLDEPLAVGTVDMPPAIEPPGTQIGPYTLREQIGEGGFGVVYVAEQEKPVARKVALKIIKPGMDTREVIARFEAERQALALMDHPNIAKVLDAGTTGETPKAESGERKAETDGPPLSAFRSPLSPPGRPFFVMELVRGVPITEFCDERKLDTRDRLALFIDVCRAVQHAHQKGIIHRDLKPSNVMVTLHDDKPVVKVIDFGVAKALSSKLTEKTVYTAYGQMLGTPLYMSPEQAQLSGLDVDTRSDVYSLGVLLYELLTSTTPFDKETLKKSGFDEMRRIIREDDPPRPSARVSTLQAEMLSTVSAKRRIDPRRFSDSLRGELDWIVMKALEKDRNRRYESASAFAADVKRYLNDEPLEASPASPLYRFTKFAKRNRTFLVSATTVTTTLLLGIVISTWMARRNARLAEDNEHARNAARQESRRAERAEIVAKRRLLEARLAEARAARWSRRIGQRFKTLRAVTEAAKLARQLQLDSKLRVQLRNQAIAGLALDDVQLERAWEGFPAGSTSGLAFDANCSHYARSDARGNVSVRRVADDRELARLPGQGRGGLNSGAAFMQFSPAGGLLAVRYWHRVAGGSSNFQVWDWRRKRLLWQPPYPVARDAFDFSPEGTYLALGRSNGAVTIHAALNGKKVRQFPPGVEATSLAFSPDGDRLAIGSFSGSQVQLRDVRCGKLLHTFAVDASVHCVAWHPQGRLLAAGCGDTNIYVWNTTTRRRHALLQGHQNSVVTLLFTPGGERLLSRAWDGTNRLWDVWTGRLLLRFAGDARRFSRDGRLLAMQSGYQLLLYEVSTPREMRSLPSSRGAARATYRQGGFSRDGRWLVVGTDRGLSLFDTARNSEAAFVPLSGREHYARFHPAGKELWTSGTMGLRRWPMQWKKGELHVGPPRDIALEGSPRRLSFDGRGRLLTVADAIGNAAAVIEVDPHGEDPSAPQPGPRRLRHVNVARPAVSPDGRWIATGTHNGFGVKVWDATTGKLLTVLVPHTRQTTVAFSPDGQWLAGESRNDLYLWTTRDWRFVRRIRKRQPVYPLTPAFSPDGRILAFAASHSAVELIEPQSGRTLALLEGPDSGPIQLAEFSPDAARLVCATPSGGIKVWDLRRIRRRLKQLGLDWDHPPYPPIAAAKPEPVRVLFDRGDHLNNLTSPVTPRSPRK